MNTQVTPVIQSMTSLELVKIINDLREEGQVELQHNNFTAKVRKVLGETEAAKFSAPLKTISGQTAQGYILPKRECHLMVMSESYKVQAAVYDLMIELESQPALNPANLSRLQLIELAMQAEQERLVLEEKFKIIEPKAQALDRLSESEGSQCITDSAKGLKIQPTKLFSLLQEKRWIYKRAGGKNWLGYQDKIQSGLLEHKITTISRSDGSEKTIEQVLLTPRGIAKVADLLNGGAV